jgi:glycosyltransferase involved in cell wall biosynthesis
MLIEAAAPLLRDGRMTIDMIGDGPMMDDLRALAVREGAADAVRFHGWLAHEAVQDVAASCEVLSFPSIREFGGGVVLEAMALGVVPLVVDYAGPGELVVDGVGRKVPIGKRDDIVAGFRAALTDMAANPAALAQMGTQAHAHVQDKFLWSRKAEQIREVYAWVLDKRPDRPEAF